MEIVLTLILKITLGIFMVGNLFDMGLRLKLGDALTGLRDGRFVLQSLLWGFVLCPAVAYVLTKILPLDLSYAIGLILLGMTPCSPFLPPMVERARGDIGYTAAFMLLASVVTVAYMPFAVSLLASGFHAGAWTIAEPLVFFLLIPLLIGLAVQNRSPSAAARLSPAVKKATGIDTVLMLVLCAVVYGEDFLGLVGSNAIGAQVLFFSASTIGSCLLSFGLRPAQKSVLWELPHAISAPLSHHCLQCRESINAPRSSWSRLAF